MSDLANLAKLTRVTAQLAQLPVHVYHDTALLQREILQLFQRGPHYVGHELLVPNVGDFATLAQENDGRMLVRNHHGIELLSNICRQMSGTDIEGARQ